MERPFVYVNMAATVDGKITSARREYPDFTSSQDKSTMDRLRAEADAVMVGARTLRADNLPLGVRSEPMRQHRRELGKPEGLVNVVVSASLALDPGARFFREPSTSRRIVATIEDADATRRSELARVAELWTVGRGEVDLPALLERLRREGVERLLVEGGGEFNWHVVRAGLLDELYLTVAPALLGGRDAPTLLEGAGFTMDARLQLELLDVERHGDELYLRYAARR